ncbi:hypothetical protein I4U23_010034 [Adineta vaga]|nr:hypothetical protein I4U23_010034 [Adineta vaga]
MGLVIPYNNKHLSQIDDVDSILVSPFILVFSRSGIPGADHFMNVVMLTTILSAGNSGLYLCTRISWTSANEGKTPKICRKLVKDGIPIYCLLLTNILATSLFGLTFENYPDFNCIPTTNEEINIISTIHENYFEKNQAKYNHFQMILKKEKKAEELKISYEKLLPFITSLTHYHRNSYINPSNFYLTSQDIQNQNSQENETYF